MPGSTKSLVKATTNIKPMSIFYIWYVELCRRANTNPISTVRSSKRKNENVLDFTADRIKSEEWTPIINALRLDTSLHVIAIRSRVVGCKFLNEINTEEKVRRLTRVNGALWTDYVLKTLLRSLGCCLVNTTVLCALELEGLPLYKEYFDMLLENLKKNKTIKSLSFKRCPIGDIGCYDLCLCLNSMINIEFLNLSSCHLTSISGQHIAKVIKYQQINRYCESWQKSLRYEEPDSGLMAGIKRITLNNNPDLGDEGLCYILNELDDDLWIKAIDMQKCNISENMAKRITDVIEYSRSLEIADFRNNNLSLVTMQQILDSLHRKQPLGIDSMYQWCTTTSTLYDFSLTTPRSTLNDKIALVQKSKSVPIRELEFIPKYNKNHALRRTRTLTLVEGNNKNGNNPIQINQLSDAKKQLMDLNNKLQQEIFKRKETERLNNELKQQLDNINKIGQESIKNKFTTASQIIKNLHSDSKDQISTTSKEKIFRKEVKPKKPAKKMKPKSVKQKVIPRNGEKEMLKQENGKQLDNRSIAQNIFEQFLKADSRNDNGYKDEEDLANLLTYVCNGNSNSDVPEDMLSNSCSSLEKLLQEITFLEDDSKLSMENSLSIKNNKEANSPKNPRDPNVKNQFKKRIGKVR